MNKRSSANDKLLEGKRRLARAHNNPDALERALQLIYAALFEHLRFVSGSANSTPNVLFQNLQRDHIINAAERALLIHMHSVRNKTAHGDQVYLTQRNVELFANLTKAILDKTSGKRRMSLKSRGASRYIVPTRPTLRTIPPKTTTNVSEDIKTDKKQETSEDVINQQKQLDTHRRTLQHYLEQQAKLGKQYTPPGVIHGIYEARQEIRRIKEVLRGWEITVTDQPDDEQLPQVTTSSDMDLLYDLFFPSVPTPKTNQEPLRQLRVFLCHASDDKPTVRTLYRRLQSDGIQPWLDEEDLVAGQDWVAEIPKAVRSSDIVIVCLSRHSVSKVGFVQKEIKYALDVADEQPDGTIFIIPLKLEECNIQERLGHKHWVEYFKDRGYEKLMHSLKARALELGIDINNDNVYRFRAELSSDVDVLRKIIGPKLKRITEIMDPDFPDVVIEVQVNMSLEELRDAMRKVDDGHVMLQTVAPKDRYTGERDYELI